MRTQIKAEVLAQMNDVRVVSAPGERGTRVRVEGDLRVRGEMARLSRDNTAPAAYASNATLTRAPDFLTLGGNGKDLHTANTQEDANRARVRAPFQNPRDDGQEVRAGESEAHAAICE